MPTTTAEGVGWRGVHDVGGSVCVDAVDDVDQTDPEWGPGISPKRSLRHEYELACGWMWFQPP